jgi:hypothetical protein
MFKGLRFRCRVFDLRTILRQRVDLASTLTTEAMVVNQLLPIGLALAIEEAAMSETLSAMMRASLAMLLLISVYIGPAQAGETLSDRELQLLFPGRFQAVVRNSLMIDITASSDGSLLARFLHKADTGQWSIRSGRLCIRFSSWLSGRTNCSSVVAEEGWYRTSDVVFRPSEGFALAVRPQRR